MITERWQFTSVGVWSEYLEYVGEVAQVEDVVKLDGGGQEGCGDALMEGQGQLHQLRAALLQNGWESLTAQMLTQDAAVDSVQSLHTRKRERKHREMPLKQTNCSTTSL